MHRGFNGRACCRRWGDHTESASRARVRHIRILYLNQKHHVADLFYAMKFSKCTRNSEQCIIFFYSLHQKS